MQNRLTYKDYFGSIQYSAEDSIFYGKLDAITDLVTFEADSVEQLQKEFEAAVDDYLVYCEGVGKIPDINYG